MLVKVDQKGRFQIPKEFRKRLKLKKRQRLGVSMKGNKIIIEQPRDSMVEDDPVLRGMIDNPLHSKVKVTRELLEKLTDEQWMGL